MYADTGQCGFPGCDHLVMVTAAVDNRARLCFEHGEMLFYDVDEFVRVWDERDPGGSPRR